MTWTDISFIDSLGLSKISSQVTIGNGVWRLFGFVPGTTYGKYDLADNSYATYTYFTNSAQQDSCTTIYYNLTGAVTWKEFDADETRDVIDLLVAAKDTATGNIVNFTGPVQAAPIATLY